jgi:hypothetical protein
LRRTRLAAGFTAVEMVMVVLPFTFSVPFWLARSR